MTSKSAVVGNAIASIEEDGYCSNEKLVRKMFVQKYKFLENLVANIMQNARAMDL